ncbi:hypothetical protein ACO2Q3_15870 [Caulobacter sp. KR2-114]|uniref:hypothetical protein n=1 Tax=Caulobacter sp. KR2-114 TaxID=3400912 RepID=UPI003C11E001
MSRMPANENGQVGEHWSLHAILDPTGKDGVVEHFNPDRRLTTIVALDVAGYAARTAADEDASAGEIADLRERVEASCERHGGRLFNTAGDGFMLEFPTVSGALAAAEALAGSGPPAVRVGVHLGEVRVLANGDLLGHGVNVAARLQALAAPGGVLVSADVRRAIRGGYAGRLVDRGEVRLDKMDETLQVFALPPASNDAAPPPAAPIAPTPPRGPSRRRMLWLAAPAVLAAAGAGGYGAWRATRPAAPANPRVAVLPFDNLSPDPQLGYFADGLSEDILNGLMRVGGMRVTARDSAFSFRGVRKAGAGQALGADYVLDGSVLRDGARLRVNARLTDVARQQTLWSESYDRGLDQGLQVEDEIAAQVASALRVHFAGPAATARQPIDPQAYDLYLKGREASRTHTPESVRHGRELLQAAVSRAPAFADAWLELATNCSRSMMLEPLAAQLRDQQIGLAAARRAVALDPGRGGAYAVASTLMPCLNHWSEKDAVLKRGLALSPDDADVTQWRACLLFESGRVRAAAALARRVVAQAPIDQFANGIFATTLTYSGQLDEAERAVDRLGALFPGQLASYWPKAWFLATSGREREAAALMQDPARPPGPKAEFDAFTALFRAAADGSEAQKRAAAEVGLAVAVQGMGYACQMMLLLARIGHEQQALDLARSIYLRGGPYRLERDVQFLGSSRYQMFDEPDTNYLFHPYLAKLRRQGALKPVFDGVGLTAFWAQVGPPDP